MMEHNLEHTISLLTRTPAALDALLRDLPETWTFRNEGEKSWSAFDVVGHLIHGERTDGMPRVRGAHTLGCCNVLATALLNELSRCAELRQHLPILLSQPLLQFNPLICLLIAIFHDHRGVERQIPLRCLAFVYGTRAGNYNRILGDFERLADPGAINLAVNDVV